MIFQERFPERVVRFYGVIYVVDKRWNPYAEFADAAFGKGSSLLKGPGIGEDDLIADIDRHLPRIAWMRLANIDDQELGAVPVLIVKAV